MSTRAQRREDRRIEAGAQAFIAVAVFLALAAGGVAHFAEALTALIVAGLIVLAFAGAAFLVMRSAMSAPRRYGICFVLLGVLNGLVWNAVKAPLQWREIRATVRSITPPPCVAETDYQYQALGSFHNYTRSKEWANMGDAQRFKNMPVTVYFNKSDPAKFSDKPHENGAAAIAQPIGTRIKATGNYKAMLTYADGFFPKTAFVEGAIAETYTVGATISLFSNPVNPAELSVVPRETVGGRKYGILAFSFLAIVGGVWLAVANPPWALGGRFMQTAPVRVPPIEVRAEQVRSTHLSPPVESWDVRKRLDRVDWYQFEKITARILEHMEWQVTRRGGARPDAGADLIARKNGETAVVQCKHWRRVAVTPNVIRELLGTKASAGFNAQEAVLFTLSSCTDEAVRFAKENRITVFDGDQIAGHIQEIGVDQFPELNNPDVKFCPKCDAAMVWRNSAVPFWGCSTYPRCRGKIECEKV